MSIAIDSQPLQEQESQRMMALIAKAAPWTLSALLHVAILLVLLFTVFFTINDIPPAELDIRTEFWAETKPIIAASPMAAAATSMNKHSINPRADKALPVAIKKLPPIIAKKNLNNAQLSLNNPISNSAFDMHISAGSDKCFFDDNAGKTGRADNIVYVIDASGSMMLSGAAQAVRDELYRVLGRLSKKQFFGIIFFTGSRTLTFHKKLLAANSRNIYAAVDFSQGIASTGPSDACDAVRQAFALLKNSPKKRNLICLLSDGELKDSVKVQTLIRELNRGGNVRINTILSGSRESAAMQSMRAIAAGNGGTFKYVDLTD